MRLDGPDYLVPRNGVEEFPDVELDHPVILPAAFAAGLHGLMRRPVRTVPVGIRMEHWFQSFCQVRGYNGLRHPVGDSGHA